MNTERDVARALLDIGGVGFSVQEPVTFKSGVLSPVYCDNRKFPFHPSSWKAVLDGFADVVEKLNIEVVAGVEAAGIPHSAALGFHTGTPSVFVRKQAKDHGTKKLIEGGDVTGKKVLLVEDLISTGGSSLNAVQALRDAGAIVDHVAVIVNYGFAESAVAFGEAKVTLHTLTSFPVILEEALVQKKISEADAEEVTKWLADPHAWQKP